MPLTLELFKKSPEIIQKSFSNYSVQQEPIVTLKNLQQ